MTPQIPHLNFITDLTSPLSERQGLWLAIIAYNLEYIHKDANLTGSRALVQTPYMVYGTSGCFVYRTKPHIDAVQIFGLGSLFLSFSLSHSKYWAWGKVAVQAILHLPVLRVVFFFSVVLVISHAERLFKAVDLGTCSVENPV